MGDDLSMLPTANAANVYRYSDKLLKHRPNEA